ncbi:MAG: ABC transporter permease [Vicinamibacterales bacterium]
MNAVLVLALKDLRVLPRVRMAFFFTIVFPVIVAVMFGYAFGGPGDGEAGAIRVALVDEDATDGSRAFVKRLQDSGQFDLAPMTRAEAETAVRRGQRAAFLVLEPGFGERSARLFYGDPREVELGADPSRKAEAGMIEGLLMKAAAEDMQRTLSDPRASSDMVDRALADLRDDPDAPPELGRFLGELKAFVGSPATQQAGGSAGPQWQPLKVTTAAVARERRGPVNAFDITFPQGVLWGLLGCMMAFGVSLVSERTRGTLVRLAMSPLSRAQILGGKALACLASMVAVQVLLYLLGFFVFGVRPASWPLLVMASLSATLAFCGLMMLVATLGTTEQAASGTAWAIMMPLSMVGGGMVPQFLMPGWMSALGNVSPVKWAILAIEGALWRGFTLAEMALPCAILVVVGVACFALGTRRLQVV